MTSEHPAYSLKSSDGHWTIGFSAMASPCEILIPDLRESEVKQLASLAFSETQRIEQKFSRYRDDSIVHAINTARGRPVLLDEETARMITYAGHCHTLSDGLFDITSGVLRRAWSFKGEEAHPDDELIASLLKLVGWEKIEYHHSMITLLPGMEIDLGGVGKEYAVDRVAQMVFEKCSRRVMVNFGGDIRAIAPDDQAEPWIIGIEDPRKADSVLGTIELNSGGVATSGESRRFCTYQGRRLGHVLDPRTGWPVADAPMSVTVIAGSCTEAGFLSTLAMLHGLHAETFLEAQGVGWECVR